MKLKPFSVHSVDHNMYHSVAWNDDATTPASDPDPEIFIMSEERYLMLTTVRGFTNLNGSTYQEHIIITAGRTDSYGPARIDQAGKHRGRCARTFKRQLHTLCA